MIIIFGPTSSGKTSLALSLCKKLNGEIISTDSRQVYKGMDIGTGKIPVDKQETSIKRHDKYWEVEGVKIHGYDLITPDEYFSAYDFAKFAFQKIRKLKELKKTPFLVGGTGFYIDVITGRIKLSGTKPNAQMRESLNKTPTTNLLNSLKLLNQDVVSEIDISNRQRIIRALEIEFNKENDGKPLEYINNEGFQYIGLGSSRKTLYERADKWLDGIWDAGLIEETQYLLKKYPNNEKLNGLVYKSVVSVIKSLSSSVEARQKAKFDIHAYIRRQSTWFKRYTEAELFDVEDVNLYRNVFNLVKSW